MRAAAVLACRIAIAVCEQILDTLTDHPDLDEPLPENYPPRRLHAEPL